MNAYDPVGRSTAARDRSRLALERGTGEAAGRVEPPGQSAGLDLLVLGGAVAALGGPVWGEMGPDGGVIATYPRQIGHYQILEALTTSASGTIYRAHDPVLNRVAALKVLHAHLARDGETRDRFVHEGRMLARMRHPNIVQVFDAGEVDGVVYLAMELVEGQSMRAVMREVGPVALPDVVHIADQVAAGLAAIHARGLLHCDVKPANIIIQAGTGRAVLLDRGVGRAAGLQGSTVGGWIVRSPAYMAPEQVEPDQAISVRTDVYQLAATVLALLTGAAPFAGEPAQVLYAVVHQPPAGLPALPEDVPPETAALLSRSLAKRQEERPETPQLFVRRLRASIEVERSDGPPVRGGRTAAGAMLAPIPEAEPEAPVPPDSTRTGAAITIAESKAGDVGVTDDDMNVALPAAGPELPHTEALAATPPAEPRATPAAETPLPEPMSAPPIADADDGATESARLLSPPPPVSDAEVTEAAPAGAVGDDPGATPPVAAATAEATIAPLSLARPPAASPPSPELITEIIPRGMRPLSPMTPARRRRPATAGRLLLAVAAGVVLLVLAAVVMLLAAEGIAALLGAGDIDGGPFRGGSSGSGTRITAAPTETPVSTAAAEAALPVAASISDFRVCNNVFACVQDEFVVGESVAACYTITPGADTQPLQIVATRGGDDPRGDDEAAIVARLQPVPARAGSNCSVVPIPGGSLPEGQYAVWMLAGDDALAATWFRALAPTLATTPRPSLTTARPTSLVAPAPATAPPSSQPRATQPPVTPPRPATTIATSSRPPQPAAAAPTAAQPVPAIAAPIPAAAPAPAATPPPPAPTPASALPAPTSPVTTPAPTAPPTAAIPLSTAAAPPPTAPPTAPPAAVPTAVPTSPRSTPTQPPAPRTPLPRDVPTPVRTGGPAR